MAGQVRQYLIENELLWPLPGRVSGGMPRLTVGGFLLRRHRLAALRDQLSDRQQATLDEALATWQAARAEWTLHYYGKIERSWLMRLNLLQGFLVDCEQAGGQNCFDNWPSMAEHRTIVHHLLAEWRDHTSSLRELEVALKRVDSGLRSHLSQGEDGQFLWLPALQPVYPRDPFWWLWVVPAGEDTADV
jgi:hypothetical protein